MKLAFIFMIAAEASRVIEPIFWKVDNQKFRDGGFTRHVQLQTKMDIFCPQYESPADEDPRTFSQSHHFQTIYMVDEDSFNNCQLDAARAKKIMSCEQPLRVKKYTMKFQEVNPNPYGLEFQADTNYYFISTSLGNDLGGITQMNDGVCKSHTMKLKIQVHEGDSRGVQKIDPEDGSDDSSPRFTHYDYPSYEEEVETQPDDYQPDEPAKEKQTELPNAIIVGVIVGTFLVILIIVAILLTRRVFENRKSSVSYPTLSDYQSSYVEKYDYPAYQAGNTGSPQTVYSPAFSPANLPASPIVSLLPKYNPNTSHPHPSEKRITDDFSYIDGSRLSNRTHEIVMV